ncbi:MULTISPECIES: hemagglutinin repeat-containing protein [unclassified Brenneria]|uniref:hemagglutinin repeat-containing protein n=1 Tax=unclassified Brenneria TaxID=2634434 RepID=UPI0018F06A3F|nr:hemagglutinin repeat-containing protein [Brenneria sp. L3-3C-1]MBJ7222384.1 hemagglutinin repeat-containing protein [Brenneria sp. L3-3C-1]MEE3643627.1 hemagglutinin repeat-containing protein [Brenneria sp. L3_3C_1]
MNKHLYRIVFNRARGILMVVADICRGCVNGSGSSGPGPTLSQMIGRLSPLTFLMLGAMGFVSLAPAAQASIVADRNAPGNQKPTILQTANGTPQVNIQTPSAGGVSRNVYSQFDVNNQGAILNNSHKQVQTQQGGWVAGNPWLAKGEAKIILNEVNSRDPSKLNGYIEVAGKKAQVVIANPSGISCDGCGFINANRATLTTGKATLENGRLKGYQVEKGKIQVQGAGMDTSRQNYTDLIAQTVEINAGIWANELNVTAGRNNVSADQQQVEKRGGASASDAAKQDQPKLAVDVAQLGGMYAGKIQLIGTEQGVGVRNAGAIGAQAGSVVITADGRIENSGSINATQDIQLAGRELDNSGKVYAQRDVAVQTRQQTVNRGVLAAQRDAALNAGGINNQQGAVLGAGINSDGSVADSGNLSLAASQRIDAQGQHLAGGGLSMTAADVNADGSQTQATNVAINAVAGSVSSRKAKISADNALNVTAAQAVSNTEGTLIAGKSLTVRADSLSGDGQLLSLGDMSLTSAQRFDNHREVIADGKLDLTVTGDVTNRHKIQSGDDLTLTANRLDNQASGEISGLKTRLALTDTLTNRGLIDGGQTRIDADTLNNIGSGRIYGDWISLQSQTLNNLDETGIGASIAARRGLDLGVGTLNNRQHALIYSDGVMTLGGNLNADGLATGQADTINNHSATIESAGDMALSARNINNVNDRLVTEVVTTSSYIDEAVLSGHTTRYSWSDIGFTRNKYGVHTAHMPDGYADERFYRYMYTRTVSETRVKESDPGQILSGGNLWLTATRMTNSDSRVVAAGLLIDGIKELSNLATSGERITTDIGWQERWYARKKKNWRGVTKTSQGIDGDPYAPNAKVETIDLKAGDWREQAAFNGSGYAVTALRTAEVGQQDAMPTVKLPGSSLFTLQPAAESRYLVETDPRFANQKQWLSSDYMLQAFGQTEGKDKRLGDGFYEQREVREQIAQLTGQRYLAGYNSDEEQYKALMDAGIAFGRQFGLTPGVALSQEQMALLTTDMVWMVRKSVTLSDGSAQSVLVPQVYAKVRSNEQVGAGSLLAGNNVSVGLAGGMLNSGRIVARDSLFISADALDNQGGSLLGKQVALQVRNDLNNIGGVIQGQESLTALAGGDINSASTLSGSVDNRILDRVAGLYVENDQGALTLSAGNDINLTASQVINAGAGGETRIHAGNNLNLATLTTTETLNSDWDSSNYRHYAAREDIGSEIAANGRIVLSAGQDLNATAASVTAQQGLQAQAGNDITLTSGRSSYTLTEHSKQSSSGMLSSESRETHDSIDHQSAVGSTFSGETVALSAGNNLQLSGSAAAGTQDVLLSAGRDLRVTTAQESHRETHLKEEKKSGLMGSGGIGFSIGQASQKSTTDTDGNSEKASTVGSEKGNVTLQAGQALSVQGSDLIAGQDLRLSGEAIAITAAEDRQIQRQTYEQKKSGLTLALSGTVGSALNTAVATAQTAKSTEDSRLKALQGVKATLSGVQAVQAGRLASAQGDDAANNNMVGISVSLGSQSSQSEQTVEQRVAQGSSLNAGRNLSLTATGGGQSEQSGDIRIQGSQLRAGQDLTLDAARDMQLLSARNSQHTAGSNKSQGGSIGLSLGVGGGGASLSVNASMNKGKGSELGEGLSHTETLLDAGRQVGLRSGRDATLQGAQVSGEQITANVGRNLLLRSEQDSDVYDSKQQNMSAGVSIPIYGVGTASASFSMSKDKLHSNYQSVQEQTGLFAGQGGYDIRVGEHTQLDGAVIGSTSGVEENRLETGTLGFSDIENKAEFKTSHSGVGISTGGPIGDQMVSNLASNSLISGNNRGDAESTTRAAVSDGQWVIRDEANQRQDVSQLSNDVEHANQTLSPIFDKEKEQKRLQQMQLIADISNQVMDIAGTEGKIIATKAAKAEAEAKMGRLSDEDVRTAREALANGKQPNLNPTDADIRQSVYQTAYNTAYNQALNDSGFGTGGAVRQGIMAVTAAAQGLAGGNIAQAIAGGAAPYLATEIKKATTDANGNTNVAANAVAHAVLGGIVAEASGNGALSGAVGAAGGELAARVIAEQLYPGKKASELSESEKQTVSTLSLLAGSLAAGTAGDSTASAVAGAQGGQNAVENNNFNLNAIAPKGLQDVGVSMASLHTNTNLTDENGNVLNPITEEERQYAMHKLVTGTMPEGQDISKAIVDGYTNGVLIAGAWYLGPAASIGKVAVGSALSGGANAAYQWYDLSQPGTENKTYDYWSTTAALVTGGLAPGRNILPNVGIAMGSAVFTDGPSAGAIGSAAAGSWAGGAFGKYAPEVVQKAIGSNPVPEFIYEVGGAFTSEVGSKAAEDLIDRVGEKK